MGRENSARPRGWEEMTVKPVVVAASRARHYRGEPCVLFARYLDYRYRALQLPHHKRSRRIYVAIVGAELYGRAVLIIGAAKAEEDGEGGWGKECVQYLE
jgi:hypothetical protein